MVLLILAGTLLVLVAVSILRSLANPVVTVTDHLTSPVSYAEADAEVSRLLGTTRGYDLLTVVPGTYLMSYRRTPGWALVLGLLTFPLGIFVVLLCRETLTLTIAVTGGEPGTRVTMVGRAQANVVRAVSAALRRRLVVATSPAVPDCR